MGMNMKSVQMSELDTLDVTCKNVVPNYQNIQKIYLVGGAITILKHMKVNGKDDIPYKKWKITNVQKTTNQIQLRVDLSCFRMPKRIIFDQEFRMVTAYLKKGDKAQETRGACAKGVNVWRGQAPNPQYEYPIDFDPMSHWNLHCDFPATTGAHMEVTTGSSGAETKTQITGNRSVHPIIIKNND